MTSGLLRTSSRRAVADLLAVVEHHDAVEMSITTPMSCSISTMVVPNCSLVEDEAAHVLLFLDVHAGHRLVEQQHRRLGRQRAASSTAS